MDKPRLVVLDCSLNHLISIEIPIWSSDCTRYLFHYRSDKMHKAWKNYGTSLFAWGVSLPDRGYTTICYLLGTMYYTEGVHTDQMATQHKKLWDSWPILLKHAWASIDETVSLLLSRSVTDHLTWHEQCFIQCSQSVPTYSENWTATPTC